MRHGIQPAAVFPSGPNLSIGSRLRAQVGGIVLGVACLGATNALGLAIPWLFKLSIDALGRQGEAAQGQVTRYALFIAGFALVQAVIRTASRVLIFNAGRNVEYELRRDVFQHLTRLPPSFYRRSPTGDIMSRLTNDLGAVRLLFGPGILNIANTAIVYTTCIWLMFALNPRLTLFALLPFPALILGGRAFTRAMYRASRDMQDQLGKMSTSLQEDLAGIAVLKLYALEPQRRAAFARLNDTYLAKALDLVRTRGSLMPLFAVIGGVGTLIVLWIGGRDVIAGRMTIGELVAFNAYVIYLSWPTIALGWILSMWQRGVAAWVRVREILANEPSISDPVQMEPCEGSKPPVGSGGPSPPTPSPITITHASISIRDLTIAHGDRKVLDSVSLDLPAGGTLAIVGRTGSGKTTLVDAIPRLCEVPRGTVFVGGHDVVDLPLRTLRGAIGYAPQEAFLFSATLADNISFGHPAGARGDDIARAAEAADLARDVAVLPDGYDTLVGERGITLSGGQRQRVALARALCAEPQVLLLDDSLSSVDAQTERAILERLRPILKGRTSVLVSHRVAAVKDADEIVVIDAGRIVERGRHADLVAGGGLYAALYREQLAAEALTKATA